MLVELSVTYAIWRVSNLRPSSLSPAILTTTAPRIQIPVLFAALMVMKTGMRSSVLALALVIVHSSTKAAVCS